jgi:protein gp37
MGKTTKIEWADSSWNPIMGCTPISPGCKNCYARRMMHRYKGRKGWPDDPDVLTFFPQRLDVPKSWKKPRMIFVCSMSDIFHEEVILGCVRQILNTISDCPQHTFLILTKRAEHLYNLGYYLPLPKNIWLGVTTENQQMADWRIPKLLEIDSKIKFISVEPMLEEVDISKYPEMDGVFCGLETGPGARLTDPKNVYNLRDQCIEMNIPFFFKSWGGKRRKERLIDGVEWNQLPMERNVSH